MHICILQHKGVHILSIPSSTAMHSNPVYRFISVSLQVWFYTQTGPDGMAKQCVLVYQIELCALIDRYTKCRCKITRVS